MQILTKEGFIQKELNDINKNHKKDICYIDIDLVSQFF